MLVNIEQMKVDAFQKWLDALATDTTRYRPSCISVGLHIMQLLLGIVSDIF